jgi:hypothetical protein
MPFTLRFIQKVSIALSIWASSSQSFCQDIVVPGAKPTMFAHEGMSAVYNESVLAFMPDGKTVYIADGTTLVYSSLVNKKWGKSLTVAFSGHWKDWVPRLSQMEAGSCLYQIVLWKTCRRMHHKKTIIFGTRTALLTVIGQRQCILKRRSI